MLIDALGPLAGGRRVLLDALGPCVHESTGVGHNFMRALNRTRTRYVMRHVYVIRKTIRSQVPGIRDDKGLRLASEDLP